MERYDRDMKLPKGRRRPRVGRLPYLLSVPFTGYWEETDLFELITAPPRQLAHLAREDELDAACVPVVEVRSLSRRFEPLGSLGLVAVEAAPLGLFASRIEPDLLGNAPIGASMQGATLVAVMEVLLAHCYKVQRPNIIPLPPERFELGAFLLVGDEAIEEARAEPGPFVYRYNLVEEWHRWTGMPLPISRWIVRKSLPDDTKRRLHDAIANSVERTIRTPGPVLDAHLRASALGCTPDEALAWLKQCTYRFDQIAEQAADHLAALNRELHRKPTSWRDLL